MSSERARSVRPGSSVSASRFDGAAACACYGHCVARTRISTTVDGQLLAEARIAGSWPNDAQMMDAALVALLAAYRSAEVDRAYAAAYGEHPIDEPDEWGDLASFRDEVSTT